MSRFNSCPCDTMPTASPAICLLVSSTLRDLKAGCDALRCEVFLRLKQRYRPRFEDWLVPDSRSH